MTDNGKLIDSADQAGTSDKVAQTKGLARKRKKLVVLGAVVVVAVATAIGFFVWHEQPSFCNAICHQPMDKYVETYYGEGQSYLAASHAKTGTTCLDCHEPTLSQQISEGMTWVSGDFFMTEDGYIYHAEEQESLGTNQFCFRCHDDGDASTGKDWSEIVAATEDYGGKAGYNVHENHMSGTFACGDCHSAHATSFMSCNDGCHDLETPEGWEGGGIL